MLYVNGDMVDEQNRHVSFPIVEDMQSINSKFYKGTKPEGIVPELIDVLIRTLDLLGETGYDVEEELQRKHDYNASRPPKHGKKY